MPTEIEGLCETIEDCYEFTLSYAAKGLLTDEGNESGRILREKLTCAAQAIRGLEAAAGEVKLTPTEKSKAFIAVLAGDAQTALAAVELVLAQPVIGSQLIDNLNASIHLRALLTDLFLITEMVALKQSQAKAAVSL